MEGSARELFEYRSKTAGRHARLALVMLLLLAVTAVWRITQGEWAIPLARVAELISPFLSGEDLSSPEALVVRSVRLPRFLAAAGTGGLLAVSGVVLQGLLSNPLAEPYTLGIASGAAFGGALGFFFGSFAVTPAAFAGALFALWLVGVIAWRSGGGGAYIVLAGIITNAVLSAGVTFLKAIADDKLGAIVLWLMGSLSGASPSSALMAWAGAAFVFVPAFVYGRQLDAVSLGEGRGELLGVDERKLRRTLLFFASIATALAVSCFGIIGCKSGGKSPERCEMASSMRAAALPVGAASMIRLSLSVCKMQASSDATVVVLPVPGPPETIRSCCRNASATAIFCQSGSLASVPEKSLSKRGCKDSVSTGRTARIFASRSSSDKSAQIVSYSIWAVKPFSSKYTAAPRSDRARAFFR